MAMGTETAAVN